MKFSISIFLLSIITVVHAFGFNRIIQKRSILSRWQMSTTEDVEDEEEAEWFSGIAETYLRNKFQACDRPEGIRHFYEKKSNDLSLLTYLRLFFVISPGCRFSCDRNDAAAILREILPPVTQDELNKEIDVVLGAMPKDNDDIQEIDFIRAVTGNTYWKQAGRLVVKELIFLDCLYSNYQKGAKLLDDESYDELKDSLTWEGSAVAVLRGDEARFIYAVAANNRGESLLSNEEYDKLKTTLVNTNSWVVNRVQDPLEKMGLQTFMGYLHRQLEG